MKKLIKILFWYFLCDALVLGFAGLIPGALSQAAAQTILVNTTLSAAVTTLNGRIIQVASATNINAPSTLDYTKARFVYVDRELMDVENVSGTNVTVIRGAEGTQAATHASGAVVFVVPDYLATYVGGGSPGQGPSVPAGSCTRTSELLLPRIQFASGIISDCLGGQWVNGDAIQTTRTVNFQLQLPNTGATAYTSAGTSTAKAANTMYCTEINLPYSKLITGLAVLNGATATTDKEIAVLYDSAGNLLANSAVAGVVASGASTYQKRAFTTPFFAVGPTQYFACIQGDSGTTATLNLLATGTADIYLTQSYGSQTFGTIPATITPPTTFGTLKGPLFFVY